MIDKGLTYAYAEGGPVASEGRPRPNPFVRPMPILYFGPDGQPDGKPVYDNITVGGPAVLPPAAAPVGDLFPQQPVVPPPPLGEPIIDYFGPDGKRVFVGIDGRFSDHVGRPVVPPPVQPVVPPPIRPIYGGIFQDQPSNDYRHLVTGPDGTSRTYSPPIFSRPSAADTRAAGYDAAIQRFANSPFVRPEGIMGLQRGKLRLS